MYLAQTYHEFFKRTKQNLYGSKLVNMPKPELYVIFTGERPENPPDTIPITRKECSTIVIARSGATKQSII